MPSPTSGCMSAITAAAAKRHRVVIDRKRMILRTLGETTSPDVHASSRFHSMCAIPAHVFGKLLSRDQSPGTPDMPINLRIRSSFRSDRTVSARLEAAWRQIDRMSELAIRPTWGTHSIPII